LIARLLFLFLVLLRHFFREKFETEKNVTHRHSQHTVCDGVSGVTEEGCLPGVPVCLVSVRGSAVRVRQGVFSVFFIATPLAALLEAST
jgi:hypothetical protein